MNRRKLNCWEYKKCGREPGGLNARTLGVCLSATNTSMNKINGGINGGRVCWLVAGTYGKSRAELADCIAIDTTSSCYQCDFHSQVLSEEGFIITDDNIREKIAQPKKYSLPGR
jgi:hypothetical protein